MIDLLQHKEVYYDDEERGFHEGCSCGWKPTDPDDLQASYAEWEEHFKSVIAEHDRKIQAEAWDDGHRTGYRPYDANPYREEQ